MTSSAATQPTRLRGITWNHSRGFLPVVATAQRFGEMHSAVEIAWEKRSLQEFADCPIERLAETFDLLVIDHPFVGYAARHPVLLPLDEHLSAEFLADQERSSVGESYRSYVYDGHLWALPIDAAAPVAAWRADVLERAGASVPRTWEELLALARRGLVRFPAIPVDSLMHFYMLCCALGECPPASDDVLIDPDVGAEALTWLCELVKLCPPEILKSNPIATYEAMSQRDDIAYCPFAYGYSNYARDGYAPQTLEFGDLCSIGGRGRLRSTLGGTGLAISAKCQNRQAALEYVCFVAGAECQRTLYVQSGGQPVHRAAWTDRDANRLTHDYFLQTLPALDRAYVRLRYCGYIRFQDQAGAVVHDFLSKGGDARSVIGELQSLYRQSRQEGETSDGHNVH